MHEFWKGYQNYFFSTCSCISTLCISLWAYAIISWWCRMHAFNLACKFSFLWTCSCSCPWCGVICCSLISHMAALSLSNWVHATAISVVTRDGKLQVIPRASNVAKHCWEKECLKFRYMLQWNNKGILMKLF